MVYTHDGNSIITCNSEVTRNSSDRNIMVWDVLTTAVMSNQIYQVIYTPSPSHSLPLPLLFPLTLHLRHHHLYHLPPLPSPSLSPSIYLIIILITLHLLHRLPPPGTLSPLHRHAHSHPPRLTLPSSPRNATSVRV